MIRPIELTKNQLKWLEKALSDGMSSATSALSELLAREITITSTGVDFIPVEGVPEIVGGSEVVVACVYVAIDGDIGGHIMLVMTLPSALNLADILLEKQPGESTELDEMDMSALEEVGNITCSYFLKAIVKHSDFDARPSPPSCAVDMAGALLSSILADVSNSADQVLIMETIFSVKGQHIKGYFFLFPAPDSMDQLLKALRQY